jgi:Winged helix DNA-binding domain
VSHALYDDRTLLRMLGMRRTMFVVPTAFAPVVQAAATDAIAERETRRLVKLLGDVGIPEGERWLSDARAATLAALDARGEALAVELAADVPALRTRFTYAEGKAYANDVTFTSQVMNGLGASGHIVRGRPRGTWAASQYRWAPATAWLAAAPPVDVPGKAEAQAELVGAWLRGFGPGTEADITWWTGFGLGEVRKALAAVGAVEVELDDGVGLVLPDDVDPVPAPVPWVALLPALDPTAMGWAGRGWYLGEHREVLFDRTGNIGPTVWADGRIVGGWGQYRSKRKGDPADGEIVVRLLQDIGAEETEQVHAEAERLRTWVGGVRFTPRFRTPLEKDLTKPR